MHNTFAPWTAMHKQSKIRRPTESTLAGKLQCPKLTTHIIMHTNVGNTCFWVVERTSQCTVVFRVCVVQDDFVTDKIYSKCFWYVLCTCWKVLGLIVLVVGAQSGVKVNCHESHPLCMAKAVIANVHEPVVPCWMHDSSCAFVSLMSLVMRSWLNGHNSRIQWYSVDFRWCIG